MNFTTIEINPMVFIRYVNPVEKTRANNISVSIEMIFLSTKNYIASIIQNIYYGWARNVDVKERVSHSIWNYRIYKYPKYAPY